MPRVIRFDPNAAEEDGQDLTLDGILVHLEVRWVPRLRGWFGSLYLGGPPPLGTPLATLRRLSPGLDPFAGRAAGGPEGVFLCDGEDADGYDREVLAEGRVRLRYFPLEELPEASEDPYAPIIVVDEGA